jgi:hypothetical protein
MRTQVARPKRTLLRTRTYGREMAAWLPALTDPGPHPLTLEACGPAQVSRRWMFLARAGAITTTTSQRRRAPQLVSGQQPQSGRVFVL